MKKCSKCREKKEVTEFYKNKYSKDGLHHYCNYCNREEKKNRYSNNENYRLKLKQKNIKNKYDISPDELELKFEKQDSSCKICKNKLELYTKGTHIDHNHKTGKVRDILCRHCNTTLGILNEDIDYIKLIIKYLEEHNV